MKKHIISAAPKVVPLVNTKHRLINTVIPAIGTVNILADLEKYESRSMHGQLPIVWKKADDFYIFDIADNKWIDFTSSIFVANVGHSNSRVTTAIKQTLEDSLMSCYSYINNIRVKYLKKLIGYAGPPFEKAFLLSAGTEATEAALKLMRMNGQLNEKRKLGIICIENNWHGRTLGAQMMSSNKNQSAWIGYQDPDIYHIPFPYPWALNNKSGEQFLFDGLKKLLDSGIDLKKDICGFMLESFQGWGAVFYPNDFVKSIEKICKEKNILLAFDEMQAGFGRTGKKFGYQHYGVTPDIVSIGKGMGGGVPLSGVFGRTEIMDLPEVGNMSSTHSANPLVCAAGIAVLEELDTRELVLESERKGKLLKKALKKIKSQFPDRISWILGEGLLQAILFKDPKTGHPDGVFASKVVERSMQKGLLLVHTGRESIKMGPPLTISDDALLEGASVISESIFELVLE